VARGEVSRKGADGGAKGQAKPGRAGGALTLRRARLAMTAASAVLLVVLGATFALRGVRNGVQSAASEPAPLAIGTALQRPRRLPPVRLLDERGFAVTIPAAWHGRWVVLAPFDSACNESCPMTTGALMQLQSKLRAAGLAGQVAVAEASVDPWKDTPARLRAYRRLTGARLELLTGTPAEVHRLWHFLGAYYKRVPESRPPSTDWYTGKPSSFNVEHSDDIFFIDPAGQERIVDEGMANVGGHLEPALRRMLNAQGLRNLAHPQLPWTAAQALQDVYWLLGRNVPASALPHVTPPGRAAARSALAGAPAPLAALHAQGGQVLGPEGGLAARLRTLRGFPVVLNAWASWCPPCRAEMPLLGVASVRFGRQVAFLGADIEDQTSQARAFLAKHPVSYPSYGISAAALSAIAPTEATPTTIYIDRGGRVVAVHPGEYGSEAALSNDIERYALGR
jgi:cytochrome oxidase Cu insertion factor (SCO1/SenC/PrrC family)/thiol-disulfide isomerase/thioredoxin